VSIVKPSNQVSLSISQLTEGFVERPRRLLDEWGHVSDLV